MEPIIHPAIKKPEVPYWVLTNILRYVPRGQLILTSKVEEIVNKLYKTDFFEVVHSSSDNNPKYPDGTVIPYHVLVKRGGYVPEIKYCSIYSQIEGLKAEGFEVEEYKDKYRVKNYKDYLCDPEKLLMYTSEIMKQPVVKERKSQKS